MRATENLTRQEAEEYVYASYLQAEGHLAYGEKDAKKRHPEFTRSLLKSLYNDTTSIVITGSKGKGSVANMTASILTAAGKSTGLMTSPHLCRFNERFRIGNEEITDEEFSTLVSRLKTEFDAIQATLTPDQFISPMGIQAAIAELFFKECKTECNVYECGKGARFDDVPNIPHQYAAINTIFLEHTRELGSTLTEIAEDKSHVITGEQKAVFSATQVPEVEAVLSARAAALHTPLKIYGRDFSAERIRFSKEGMFFDVALPTRTYQNLQIPLLGEHQARNCALALALCQEILGGKEIPLETLRHELIAIHWPGRMEILRPSPFCLLDACINRDSAKLVFNTLQQLRIHNSTAIIGIPEDKDYLGVAQTLAPLCKNIILTKSQNVHYRFSEQQCATLQAHGIVSLWAPSLTEAFAFAESLGQPVLILGTTSLVAEATQLKKAGFFSAQ